MIPLASPTINYPLFTNTLPFQGEIYGGTLTHRVAVGCYTLPLKGRRTCYPTGHQDSGVNVCFADFFYGA
jgi:membrane-associated PAP2 superfamily phosphatase